MERDSLSQEAHGQFRSTVRIRSKQYWVVFTMGSNTKILDVPLIAYCGEVNPGLRWSAGKVK